MFLVRGIISYEENAADLSEGRWLCHAIPRPPGKTYSPSWLRGGSGGLVITTAPCAALRPLVPVSVDAGSSINQNSNRVRNPGGDLPHDHAEVRQLILKADLRASGWQVDLQRLAIYARRMRDLLDAPLNSPGL
jgi:hypothetical protein